MMTEGAVTWGLRAMAEEISVAVIGVGGMGANHARVLSGMKGVNLVGVVDRDVERARTVADLHGCRVLGSLDEVTDLAQAATIAVPSSMHAEVAVPLLAAGVHCLIEKPFVTCEAEADSVLTAAERGSARIVVGHIERFNPAVRQLREILGADDHRILALDARRMSAVSGRITDVDVVTDLMVHDLDIVLNLVGRPVSDLVARSVRGPEGAPGGDYVTVVLSFDSGAVATFTASRITQNQVRSLEVTTDQRFLTVDYPNQELLIYRQGRIGNLGAEADASRYVLDVGTERVFVRRTEPLVTELAHFVAVARGEQEPEVSAHDGLDVMRLVWRIHAALDVETTRV